MSIQKLRLIWISLLVILVGWLLWRSFVPLGTIRYTSDLSKSNYFIGKLSPAERVELNSSGARLIGEPVYFSLFTPRAFKRAIVTIDFSSPPTLIEAGLRRDKNLWSFDLKPMYSALLEQLREDKNSLRESGLLLWQKNKTYNSIADFLKKLPPLNSVMNYRYPLANDYQFNELGKEQGVRRYDVGLRGSYQLYTYSSGESIAMTFTFKDRNEIAKERPIEINVYRGADVAFSKIIPDSSSAQSQTISFETKNLERGVYRVEVKASDDIISTSITTNQKKLSFIGSIWLTDPKTLPMKLYTDSETITAQTNTPLGKQKILVEGKVMDINESYRQFVFNTKDTTRRTKEVVLSNKDLVIAGDGVWSFSKDGLFNPSLRTLTASSIRESLGADYLIANYSSPQILADGSYRSVLEFDLRGAYREKGKYSFMISAPRADLKTKPLEIKRISVELKEPTLFGLIKGFWQ